MVFTYYANARARGRDPPLQRLFVGSKLDLDASFGVATQLGFDYDISDKMHLNFDLRWMDIDTDANLDGVSLGTVEIDSLIYSVTVGWKF